MTFYGLTKLHGVCLVYVCDLAGVMYWGDSKLELIEVANLDGTGRRVLLRETNVHYFAFVLHGGSIYFTDWFSKYDYLFSSLARLTHLTVIN